MKKFDLAFILLLSIGFRIGAAIYLGSQVANLPGTADQLSYHTLAQRVLDGHGFTFDKAWWPLTAAGAPTAHWSYLYTLYLAAVYAIFGVNPLVARLVQAIIVGLLQPYLTYILASQIFQSRPQTGYSSLDPNGDKSPFETLALREQDPPSRFGWDVPLIAAAINGIYPYFIYYSATLMTEPFYITAILASFVLAIALSRRIPTARNISLVILFGLALTIAVLLRQLFLLFLPFLFFWLLLASNKKHFWSKTVPSVLIPVVILTLVILPITIYNYTRFQRFVLLNTNAGFAFFWANHTFYDSEFIPASKMGKIYQELVPAELRRLDEASLDQELLKLGVQYVLGDPERYIRLSLSRIPIYFKFWPDPASSFLSNFARVSSFGLFLPFMTCGLLLSFVLNFLSKNQSFSNRLSSPLMLLYLFVGVYSGIHILSWVQVRYRLPVDAVLIPFAALGLVYLTRFTERAFRINGSRKTIFG